MVIDHGDVGLESDSTHLLQGWFHGHGLFTTIDGMKYEGGGSITMMIRNQFHKSSPILEEQNHKHKRYDQTFSNHHNHHHHHHNHYHQSFELEESGVMAF